MTKPDELEKLAAAPLPVLYARQWELDAEPLTSKHGVLTSRVAEDDWNVPLYLGAPTRTKLWAQIPDEDGVMRQWYFDCDGHYIDVERDKDGKYSVYFRNRTDESEGWLDQADSASTGAAPEAPASEQQAEASTFALCMLVAEAAYKEGSGTDRAVARDKLRPIVDEVLNLASSADAEKCIACDGTGHSTGSVLVGGRCMHCNGSGVEPATAATTASASGDELYVECRECSHCLHVGINDASTTLAACHNCDWSGPSPVEDICPGCADSGCMGAACPKCGAIYKLLAEKDLRATAPSRDAAPLPKPWRDAFRDVYPNYPIENMKACDMFTWAEKEIADLRAALAQQGAAQAAHAGADTEQDRRALELANAALIAAQPCDITPKGWERHHAAIDATNCALHKPAASTDGHAPQVMPRSEP